MTRAVRSARLAIAFTPALAAALLAVVCTDTVPLTATALADEAAMERRLKRIDVPKPLRDDVRAAIDRSVTFLAAQQRDDGVWVDPGDVVQVNVPHGDVLNALCTLALLHADTQRSRAAAKLAVARLFPPGHAVAPQLQTTTYGAGLGLLLLNAMDGDRDWIATIAGRIANGRDTKSGTWAYRTGPPRAVGLNAPPNAPQLSGPLNLSTAQFAVLGLHAATRRRTPVSAAVWDDVLDGLLAAQQSDGSWTYDVHHPEVHSTYPTATFMGIANLTLAAQHLRVDEDTSRGTSRRRRVESALDAGRTALAADGVLELWTARRGGGGVDGYALWSLEKACVFLGTERLDGVPWYADAAQSLVTAQQADGSWTSQVQTRTATDSLSTTAFALLVLVRDIESLTAVTGGADVPPDPVVTPSGGDPAQRDRAAGPASTAVPIDVAAAALVKLRAQLLAPTTTNREFLDLLARARDDFAPAADRSAPPVDPIALLREIDVAILDVLFLAGEDPGGDEEGRRPVNRRAAELLFAGTTAAPADLSQLVERRLEKRFADGKPTDGPLASTPYRPAFELLAARGGADAFAWMLDAALHDDLVGERSERALAFLLAVPRFRGLPGAVRLEAAEAIAQRYVGREGSASGLASATPGADPRDRCRWSRFRPRVVDALLALAANTTSGSEPRDANGRALLTVAAFSEWLRDHDDRRRPPWR
ncbi:MAG: hypothetical protein K8T90_18000 [Planctomycetes bacterium]|nr:hypothetical protein [Planctomycetota bacterium]